MTYNFELNLNLCALNLKFLLGKIKLFALHCQCSHEFEINWKLNVLHLKVVSKFYPIITFIRSIG